MCTRLIRRGSAPATSTGTMNRFIICFSILVVYSPFFANTEKLILMLPTKQIRRSPTLPVRSSVLPSHLKFSPFSTYGSVRPGMAIKSSNQLPHSVTDFEQAPNSVNHVIKPYGKGVVNYGIYARGYIPYDKLKGGLVPLINQNRYAAPEASRPRPQVSPVYGSTPTAGTYYQRPVEANPYLNSEPPPTKSQLPIDRPQLTFTNQRPLMIGNQEPSVLQNSQQPVASNNYPKVGPTVVQPVSNSQQVTSKPPSDLVKESTSVIGKVPSVSAFGPGKEFVIQDTLLLDEYEKKIAEFAKSWPKLSAFPGSFGSASSFFPGSALGQYLSSGVSRSSDFIDFRNSIGRQGYAVKEEINEPPIDFRTMPIITSPFYNAYPTPTTASLYKNAFG